MLAIFYLIAGTIGALVCVLIIIEHFKQDE